MDLIFQKFDEDPGFSIHALDIAVNAVATSVKDFFFKRLPPLLPQVSRQEEREDVTCNGLLPGTHG